MQHSSLESQGLEVSELGLGCMGMSEFYGTPDGRGRLPAQLAPLPRRELSEEPGACRAGERDSLREGREPGSAGAGVAVAPG